MSLRRDAHPRARARRTITRFAARHPQWLLGDRLENVTAQELSRRLDSPDDAERASADLAGLERSRNPRAVRAALRAWSGHTIPAEHLARLAEPEGRAARDGRLIFPLLRAQRRSDDRAGFARTIARIRDERVVGVDIPGVIREALDLADPRILLTLGESAERRTLPESDLQLLRTVAGVSRELSSDARPAQVVQEHRDDALAIGTTVVWLRPELGLSALQDVGTAMLEAPGTSAEAARRTAKVLRSVGDLRLSSRLAGKALEAKPDDRRLQSAVDSDRAVAELLDHGWSPPEAEEPAYSPLPGTVDYLLHSSLPYVSLGYSTRTHGLLTALNAGEWEVRGITRPGFPYGEEGWAEGDVAPQDRLDGVTYARLLDGRSTIPLSPLDTHIQEYARLLTPLVSERRTGLLHAASNYRNGLAAATVGRRLGIPTIYEVRGLWEYTRQARQPQFSDSDLFALTARLEADACRAADRVITITAALKGVLVERGVDADSISVIPNGVDTERFRPMPRDEVLAAELGLVGRTVIGYVGTVQEYEGLHLLLEAAHALSTTRSDFAVLIVGDGRSVDDLQRQARELELGESVVFTGRVPHDQVERYYSLIDVAPFPRLPVEVAELVSPLKPFEAMAMGKAVVVSSVAAMAEVVEDGKTGLVFTKASAADLTTALRRLLDDPELRMRLADQGRRMVIRERDWAALAQGVADIYTEVWDRHHAGSPKGDHTSA